VDGIAGIARRGGCVVRAAHLAGALGIGVLHLHVHVGIAVLGAVDAHLEGLLLVPRKTVFAPCERYAPTVSLDELKVVGWYRFGARRLAGLRCLRRLRKCNRLEDEIAHRESGGLDRLPGAWTRLESGHCAVDRVSS
jgi:hypothetical protein